MSNNVEPSITPKQALVIEALVSGYDQRTAAKLVKLNENTVGRWMKQPTFQQALRQARKAEHDAWFSDFKKQLRELAPQAITVLKKHIMADVRTSPFQQARALELLIDKCIALEETELVEDLKVQIAELHARLDRQEGKQP